ncbi:tetratricopeptide repeat protein [Granulicella cerasi]|uniref:Tetratricopeptide repeat protein n=1 Tax=Granulicella cerasi TaxID=741063 RepID=A0ABW1Z8L7_9BACT|nr:tetratricopeptide repeat protein [Granulicella cerasi]
MKNILRFLFIPILAIQISPLHAQDSLSALLKRASSLREGGESRKSIALLQPALQNSGEEASSVELGKAWNLLGASYQDAGLFRDAARCHERAIQILREDSNGKAELASALDNLGSVENWIGTPQVSRALRMSAYRIYGELGDQVGQARTANNLAVIAIHGGDFRTAKRYAKTAQEIAKGSPAIDGDDLAALESVAGTIALHDGQTERAIEHLSRAINSWTQKHGRQHFLVGLGYSLRAQAFAARDEGTQALSDIEEALRIEADVVGRGSAIYWQTQTVHASLLRDFGDLNEASHIEKESDAVMARIKQDQCNQCTTTATGFHPLP